MNSFLPLFFFLIFFIFVLWKKNWHLHYFIVELELQLSFSKQWSIDSIEKHINKFSFKLLSVMIEFQNLEKFQFNKENSNLCFILIKKWGTSICQNCQKYSYFFLFQLDNKTTQSNLQCKLFLVCSLLIESPGFCSVIKRTPLNL